MEINKTSEFSVSLNPEVLFFRLKVFRGEFEGDLFEKRSPSITLTIKLVRDVRHKSHLAGALDSERKLTLMLCASACDSSGKKLGTFAYELAETSCILVINVIHLICAENANFLSSSGRLTIGALLLCIFGSLGLGSRVLVVIHVILTYPFDYFRSLASEREVIIVRDFLELAYSGIAAGI